MQYECCSVADIVELFKKLNLEVLRQQHFFVISCQDFYKWIFKLHNARSGKSAVIKWKNDVKHQSNSIKVTGCISHAVKGLAPAGPT
jgi:hypothetical protein